MRIIGSLIALPYEFAFFVVWLASSLARPMLLLSVFCVLSNPTAAWRKLLLLISTVQYLVFCNDKKWKAPTQDPASFFKNNDDAKVQRKTIIFVRHGESSWNDTFNKGDRSVVDFIIHFIPNLLYAIAVEWYFFASGKEFESWFFDSPLSDKGKRQAEGVKKCLGADPAYLTPKEANLLTMLRGGDMEPSGAEPAKKACSAQLVSSNLRRAIATMAIGFQDRLARNYEHDSILILPALQEISRNPDALSITPPQSQVVAAWTDPKALEPIYRNQIDTSKHLGNKPINGNGLLRLQEFCKIIFEDIDKDAVIAAGHSLWFRSFFRTFLPHGCNHISKTKKLANGGVVGLTLERIEVAKGEYQYMICPTSIVVLHGGF